LLYYLLEKDILFDYQILIKAIYKMLLKKLVQIIAHSKQIHYYIGTDSKLLLFSKWLLPLPIFKEILKLKAFNVAIDKN
jgi:hypothetical protein